MMSVLEYAEDVSLSVSTILDLCKRLDINASSGDDMLDDEAIIMLDNEIDNGDYNSDDVEETYDEVDSYEEELEFL